MTSDGRLLAILLSIIAVAATVILGAKEIRARGDDATVTVHLSEQPLGCTWAKFGDGMVIVCRGKLPEGAWTNFQYDGHSLCPIYIGTQNMCEKSQ